MSPESQQTAPSPVPDLDAEPRAEQPAGQAAAASGGGAPAWVPILTSVACAALMGLVLYFATRDGGTDAPRGAETSSTGPFPPRPDAVDLHGAPPRRAPGSAALAGCGDLDPENPPRIELVMEGGELDLGNLKQGAKITREVTFRSAGPGPLCVVAVKSSCGCLKASLGSTKRIYAPGETGIVRLAVDTTGRVGVINKRVTITCNDPRTPLRSFHVKMDINAGLLSDPRLLQFGRVAPGTPTARSLYLRTSKAHKDWKVTGVRSVRKVAGVKPTEYTYEVEELNDPRHRRVKVRIFHPGMDKIGSFHDRIAVSTTHPDRPEVIVDAHLHVVARIVFRARTISMGFVRPGVPRGPTTARIEAGAPGITFAVTGVEIVPTEGASFGPGGAPFVVAGHGKDARGWWIKVNYDGKARKPGLLKALLRVKTDDKAQPVLEIPVRATVRSAD